MEEQNIKQTNFFWLIVSLIVLALFVGMVYLVIQKTNQKTDVYAPGVPEQKESFAEKAYREQNELYTQERMKDAK